MQIMNYDRLPSSLKLKIYEEWVKAFKDLGNVQKDVADAIAELTVENWYKEQLRGNDFVFME